MAHPVVSEKGQSKRRLVASVTTYFLNKKTPLSGFYYSALRLTTDSYRKNWADSSIAPLLTQFHDGGNC
jgi:hypothetical protein